MSRRHWTDEQLTEAVKVSFSYAQVLRRLRLRVAGSNYDTIKRKIKQLGIDISHFTGQGWNVGARLRRTREPIPLGEILVEHSTRVNVNRLRQRLIAEGVKEYRCESCGLREWLGHPIALELHHVNGIREDMRFENLTLLCPNCHALTDNYRGKRLRKRKE